MELVHVGSDLHTFPAESLFAASEMCGRIFLVIDGEMGSQNYLFKIVRNGFTGNSKCEYLKIY